MSRTKIVSTGNPNLMFDFNSFLSRWNPVTFEESLDFVKKVKVSLKKKSSILSCLCRLVITSYTCHCLTFSARRSRHLQKFTIM
ncbi:hypothetical protein GW17_00035013 [Ensete ventricosum]|nr:hypothetical protein GW17_00035013 [Ensete ventricosum]